MALIELLKLISEIVWPVPASIEDIGKTGWLVHGRLVGGPDKSV